MVTWPPSRSFSAGPEPLYGTWVILTPAMPANSSAARCTLEPVPVEAKVSLPSSRFASAINSAIECAGDRRMHQHDIAARRDQADRREILARVVADVGIERRIDRERARRDQKRVAVGLGLRHLARRDGAAGAAAVLDHDGLAEARAHPLGDDARDHVVAAAGRVGHDQRDRVGRIVGGRMTAAGAIRMTAASAARSDGPCHCALAPDFFTMADHLVSSLSMSAAYSSGVEASGSVPSAASFCFSSSDSDGVAQSLR